METDIAKRMELLASEVEWELPIHVSGLLNDGAAEIRSLREAVRVLGEYAAEWQVANGASDLTGTIRGDYGDDDAWTLTEGVSAALRIDEADRSMMANPIAAAAVEAARKGGER